MGGIDGLILNLQNSGQVAPLDEIIRLKEKYRFRVLLDESNSFGVLGKTGRGLTEYFGVLVFSFNFPFVDFLIIDLDFFDVFWNGVAG